MAAARPIGSIGGSAKSFLSGGVGRSLLPMSGMILGTALTMSMPGDPQQKTRDALTNVGLWWATMGMASGMRQFLWTFGLGIAPALPAIIQSFGINYRSALQARTSAAIPFGHGNVAMDHAFSALQIANKSMREGYGTLGGEASFMAARYMSRS